MPLPQWLKHAFAVDDGPLNPTPEQSAMVEKLAGEVVRRGMTVPALAFLEMTHPLNYVASQAIHFFTPMISTVTDSNTHKMLAEFLEHRGAIEYVCQRIEAVQLENRSPGTGG